MHTFLVILIAFSAIKNTIGIKYSIEQKVKTLKDLQAQGLVTISDVEFRDLVALPPRNYSVFLMTTALSKRRGCDKCIEVANDFKLLLNEFRTKYNKLWQRGRLFFFLIDVDSAPGAFKILTGSRDQFLDKSTQSEKTIQSTLFLNFFEI